MNPTKPEPHHCLLGAHFSIAKGLDRALLEARAYGCSALQLFTKNANTWKERFLTKIEIRRFENTRQETGITQIASHASYLINLASPEKQKRAMSAEALAQELVRSTQLQIPYVVLHPGSHMGEGEAAGIDRIVESVNAIFMRNAGIQTRLLFETTAGQGSSIGSTFEQLAAIIGRIQPNKRTGICLDTSHIFAAGYDIRTCSAYRKTLGCFDRIIGLKRLCLIHLNDSKKELGSRVDRHEHIGEGKIGIRAFESVMKDRRLIQTPKIIETPKQKSGQDADRINLKRLRRFGLNCGKNV